MKKIQAPAYAPMAIGASAGKPGRALHAESNAIASVGKHPYAPSAESSATASAGKGFLQFVIALVCYATAGSPLTAQSNPTPKQTPIAIGAKRTSSAVALAKQTASAVALAKQTASAVALAKQTASAVALAKQTASAVALAKQTASAVALAKADSLFKLKQFTQSFELYNRLFQQKKYSPSMLLKMAYIQEGLTHLSQSLFYLNLYYQASHDEQALVKIMEVAARNKLEGYSPSDSTTVFAFLKENYFRIAGAIIAIIFLLLALQVYRKRKSKKVLGLVCVQIFFLAILTIHINFATSIEQGIVAFPSTYLMSGPSAGASVVSIIDEGNQLEILGHKDVWLKVKWMDKIAYVKESSVLPVHL
jgi:hypothetical protein